MLYSFFSITTIFGDPLRLFCGVVLGVLCACAVYALVATLKEKNPARDKARW